MEKQPKLVALVVDDEEAVRRLAVRVLERAGFDVRVAASAEDALAVFDRGAERIDILMTDVILPGRNGLELARELRARLPALKVLLVSGYGDRAEVRDAEVADIPDTTYLAKPFTSSDVVEAVRRLLREGR